MASPANQATSIVLDLRLQPTEDGVTTVHGALGECWSSLRQSAGVDQTWCNAFTLAVAEIAANIIQHAGLPASSTKPVTLTLTRYPDRLVGRFVDYGIPAQPPEDPEMPSVDVPYTELGERGRGLALVQATTDRFEYLRTESGENIWTIEKMFLT